MIALDESSGQFAFVFAARMVSILFSVVYQATFHRLGIIFPKRFVAWSYSGICGIIPMLAESAFMNRVAGDGCYFHFNGSFHLLSYLVSPILFYRNASRPVKQLTCNRESSPLLCSNQTFLDVLQRFWLMRSFIVKKNSIFSPFSITSP